MEQIITALCDGIIAILTAISKFDITQIDPNRLAQAAQVTADVARIIYTAINIAVVVLGV
ncbi:MAG: hypothetical protein IJK60_05720 [Clostridia bacterium]|nr:hypothetical protein [Clostridia bacterium]